MSQSTHASKNAALQNDVSNVRYALAVASGKGGVGKSTTAVNLAISFAQRGLQVGLLDADIYGPNIPTMMGVDVLPEPSGLQIVPAEPVFQQSTMPPGTRSRGRIQGEC